MARLKNNQERAKLAITMMWLSLVAGVLMLISEMYTYSMVSDINSGAEISMGSYQLFAFFVGAVAVVFLIVYVLTAVYFIMWFRRAYYNLHKLVGGLKYSEGWAAGAWFVPVFNLFGPYQIANDLITKGEKYLVDKSLIESSARRHTVKGWWWAFWICSSILSQISTRMEGEFASTTSVVIAMVASVVSIGAAYLAIQMIKDYSEMEKLMAQVNYPSVEDSSDILDAGI